MKYLFLLLPFSLIFSLSFYTFSNENNPDDNQAHLLAQKKKYGEFSSSLGKQDHSNQAGNLSNLKEFIEKDIPDNELCPLPSLHHYLETIHYYYRLLTLSFIYEAIEDYEDCNIDWLQIFSKKCHPQSEDMKLFLKRANTFFKNDLSKKALRKKTQENGEIKQIRLAGLSASQATSAYICQQDILLFQKICSEKDHFYGLSSVPEMTDILVKSHTIKIIDDKGQGEGCLKRFVDFYQSEEENIPYLPLILKSVYKKLKSDKKRIYQEGSLFLPGSLREFDTKGLTNFIFKENSSTPVIITSKKSLPKAHPIASAPVEETPKQAIVVTPPPLPSTPEPKPQLVSLSAFNKALQSFNNNPIETPLNMDDFKKDYLFSPDQIKKLEPTMADYSQRRALKEMKDFDQLGDKKLPLSLFFLKYLIDRKIHQSLYNVCNILGEKFYIINDLENSKEAVLIQLKYEKNTKKWKISIVGVDKNS